MKVYKDLHIVAARISKELQKYRRMPFNSPRHGVVSINNAGVDVAGKPGLKHSPECRSSTCTSAIVPVQRSVLEL